MNTRYIYGNLVRSESDSITHMADVNVKQARSVLARYELIGQIAVAIGCTLLPTQIAFLLSFTFDHLYGIDTTTWVSCFLSVLVFIVICLVAATLHRTDASVKPFVGQQILLYIIFISNLVMVIVALPIQLNTPCPIEVPSNRTCTATTQNFVVAVLAYDLAASGLVTLLATVQKYLLWKSDLIKKLKQRKFERWDVFTRSTVVTNNWLSLILAPARDSAA